MMHDLHKHGEITVPFEHKGKTYKLHALRLSWLRDLEALMIEENTRAALRACDKFSQSDRIRLAAEVASRGLSQASVWDELTSIRGARFIVWRSINAGDQSFRIEDVDDLDMALIELARLIPSIGRDDAGGETADGADPTTVPPPPGTT